MPKLVITSLIVSPSPLKMMPAQGMFELKEEVL